MVTVKAWKEQNEYRLDIAGHAGYNPGNDIVCAAVSILATTLAQQMQELEDIDAFSAMECVLEAGNVHIYARVREGRVWRYDVLFDTVMTGFQLLNNTFPEHVSVECGWENEK